MSPVSKANESPDTRTLVRSVFGADVTRTLVEVELYASNMSIALPIKVTLPPLWSRPAGRADLVNGLKLTVANVMFEPYLVSEYEKEKLRGKLAASAVHPGDVIRKTVERASP